jgi:hypothetical protein
MPPSPTGPPEAVGPHLGHAQPAALRQLPRPRRQLPLVQAEPGQQQRRAPALCLVPCVVVLRGGCMQGLVV